MKYKYLCCLLLLLSFVSCKKEVKPSDAIQMIVGTYTDGGSKGIYSYKFDQESGKSVFLSTLEITNPSYLTFNQNGNVIYAVSETNDENACVYAISYDKQTGKMKIINSMKTNGEDPCYVETNGSQVLTANYSGGSMSEFILKKNALDSVITLATGSWGGPDTVRQSEPHIHCARFSPDGKFIFMTDFSGDQLLRLDNQRTDSVRIFKPYNLTLGTGPRHFIYSKDKKYMYLIGELSSKVTVLTMNEGELEIIQEICTDTINARGGADIHLSPDGKFLYSSNRLEHDGIAIFSVDQKTGKLKKIGYQETSIHPRQFNITPNGKYLLCACRDDNVIQVFERNKKTGMLKKIRKSIRMSKPVCVRFFK
jgi:6-phosphogluconolactonase (cycloisomerase 2 family)